MDLISREPLVAKARLDAQRLAHDVGKYISRTARNLPDGPLPGGVMNLLWEDLFETDGKRSAKDLFDDISKDALRFVKNDKWVQCETLLTTIDKMRDEIENRREDAIRRAGKLAIEVDSLLSNLAGDLNGDAR